MVQEILSPSISYHQKTGRTCYVLAVECSCQHWFPSLLFPVPTEVKRWETPRCVLTAPSVFRPAAALCFFLRWAGVSCPRACGSFPVFLPVFFPLLPINRPFFRYLIRAEHCARLWATLRETWKDDGSPFWATGLELDSWRLPVLSSQGSVKWPLGLPSFYFSECKLCR